MLGLMLILLGVVFLLNNLGLITGNVWNIIWPSIIILIGLWFLIRIPFRRRHWRHWRDWDHKFEEPNCCRGHSEKRGEDKGKEEKDKENE
jgi:ABC-type nickel/cobalt efflux system permease component RcnA